MKGIKIVSCFFLLLLVMSCSNQHANHEHEQTLANLMNKTEHNNAFVLNAKKKLQAVMGNQDFDSYVIQHGILKCLSSDKQSECVLNFYLTETEKFTSTIKINNAIAETQAQFNQLAYFSDQVQNYCNLSADFISLLYTSPSSSFQYYQQLFMLNDKQLSALIKKINNDTYSKFLINENSTVLEEMKLDFMEQCLADPKSNIINYSDISRTFRKSQ